MSVFDRRGGIGRKVTVITDPSQGLFDRYKRLLGYVTVNGGRKSLNGVQLDRGWSKAYVYDKPFSRLRAFRRAANRAKRTDRGAWALCNGRFHRPE